MPISDNIGAAIEQLRPELPALLSNDYSQFIAQLETSLARGNEDQVLELFEEKYPALYERLLDILGQQREDLGTTKGFPDLYGNSIAPQPFIRYECKIGPHCVNSKEVQERNVAGEALCPQHHVPMVYIEKGSAPNEEKK